MDSLWPTDSAFHQLALVDASGHVRTVPAGGREAVVETVAVHRDRGEDPYIIRTEFSHVDRSLNSESASASVFWLSLWVPRWDKQTYAGRDIRDFLLAYARACGELLQVGQPDFVLHDGTSLDLYWSMSDRIRRDAWKLCATALKEMAEAHGLPVNDARTTDIAGFMRMPTRFESGKDMSDCSYIVGFRDTGWATESFCHGLQYFHHQWCNASNQEVNDGDDASDDDGDFDFSPELAVYLNPGLGMFVPEDRPEYVSDADEAINSASL